MEINDNQKRERSKIILTICIACAVVCVVVLAAFTTLAVILLNKDDTTTREDLHQKVATKFQRNIVEVKTGTERGSGVIVDNKEGKVLLVTNYHVIKLFANEPILIRFYGDSEFVSGALLLGFDSLYDIAVLEFEHKLNFSTEDIFGAMQVDFEPNMGEGVLAIGNALGNGIAAVDGIVSKVNQIMQPDTIDFPVPLIKTTAPLNSGNSGGGLFNLDGQLIGINGYRTSQFNGTSVDGISYAIPVNIVYTLYRAALSQRNGDTLNIPNTRIGHSSDDVYYIQSGMGFNLKFNDGKLLVSSVSAAVLDLMMGDEVTSIGGVEVKPNGYSAIIAELLSYRADNTGERLVVKYSRNGVEGKAEFDKFKFN